MTVTGIFSDSEGWNNVEQFPSIQECEEWFLENGIDLADPTECNNQRWNPSPMMIIGEEHQVRTYTGYRY